MPDRTDQAIRAVETAKIIADEAMISPWMTDLLLALKDLALGHCIQETRMTDNGVVQRIYTVPPDFKALQYLTERILGRTPQRHEITGKDGGSITIVPMMLKEQAIEEGLWAQDQDRTLALPAGEDLA